MQCTGFLPGYYYPRDHNAGLNGNAWTTPHNDIDWNSSRGFNISLPQFKMNQYQDLVHQKEVLRQMILKHEATFRYQVNELHRVYGRQRDLLNEIKRRKLAEDHLRLQALESNIFMPQLRSEISERTYWPIVNLTSIEPFVPSKGIFQESSNSTGKTVEPGGVYFSGQNVSKEFKVSPSKSNTSRKRMLDLELPAEDYIDNVEVEPFEEENPVKRPSPQPQCYSKVSFVTPGDSSTSLSTCRGPPLLFDLNEPAEPAESECLNSAVETENIHKEIRERDQDFSDTERAECSKQNKEGRGGNGLNSFDEASSVGRELLPCNQPASLPPENADKNHAETRTDISLLVSSWRKYKEIPIAVQALPCFTSSVKDNKASGYTSPGKGMDLNLTAPTYLSDYQSASTSKMSHLNFLEGRNVEIHKSSEVVDSSKVLDSTPESRKCTRDNSLSGARVDIASKLSTAKICIDLNSCIKEELLSTSPGEATNPTTERDLEGPVSPENKECSPPRGDSEDIIINTPIHLSKRGHSDSIEELDKVAADILVFISSSVVRRYSKTAIGEPSEASSNCLGWFAEVATSLASNQANEVEQPMEDHFERNVLLSDRTDCSGEVKLNLRGENIDKSHCHFKVAKEKEKDTALRNQPRRGQARTVNQKDFQTDVAPAVDSLLHQVNETNIAPRIGALRKTPSRTSSRGMRLSNDRERTVSSLLPQHTFDNKQGMTDRFLKGWGLTKRRQKARRAQAYISPLNFS